MAKLTRQKAIEQMCRNCLYDPIGGNGTWKEQVNKCTSLQCPLFNYRPAPRRETQEEKEKRLQRLIASP